MNYLSAADLAAITLEGVEIIDARPLEQIEFDSIVDAISISWDENFITTFQHIVADDSKVIVIAEEGSAPAIERAIRASGFTGLKGIALGSATDTLKKTATIFIEADEFAIDFNHDEFYLIDIRSNELFEKEHLEWAENMPLEDIDQLVQEMSDEMRIYIVGDTHANVATAATIFMRNGFKFVRAVLANYETFKSLKLPMVKANKTSTTKS